MDLGCGKVPLYGAYRDYVSETICVDWDRSLHGSDYLDARCDLAGALPFPDQCFDTIILSDVLEHIPDPERLWGEMFRILRNGGSILLSVPFFYWLHETPYDFYRYTEYALRRHALSVGLSVELLQPLGGSPEILADIIAKHALHLPRFGRAVAAAVQYAVAVLRSTKLGSAFSSQTSKKFPLGYFMVARKSR